MMPLPSWSQGECTLSRVHKRLRSRRYASAVPPPSWSQLCVSVCPGARGAPHGGTHAGGWETHKGHTLRSIHACECNACVCCCTSSTRTAGRGSCSAAMALGAVQQHEHVRELEHACVLKRGVLTEAVPCVHREDDTTHGGRVQSICRLRR